MAASVTPLAATARRLASGPLLARRIPRPQQKRGMHHNVRFTTASHRMRCVPSVSSPSDTAFSLLASSASNSSARLHHDEILHEDEHEDSLFHAQSDLVVLLPKSKRHSSTVFFLHGLGDSAMGWLGLVQQYFAASLPDTKFVLPTAPTQAVTVANNEWMPSWFDIPENGNRHTDQGFEGLEESQEWLHALITEELETGLVGCDGTPHQPLPEALSPHRIVVAGFSQGGAVALYTAMNMDTPLGGVLGVSSYLPKLGTVEARLRKPPASAARGKADIGAGAGAPAAEATTAATAATATAATATITPAGKDAAAETTTLPSPDVDPAAAGALGGSNFGRHGCLNTPFQLLHGSEDMQVQVKWAKSTLAALHRFGAVDAHLTLYDRIGHGVDERGLNDIAAFFRNRLA